MHSISFLQDLAVVMVVAGIVTVICHRLKQPVVLGYILAGFIIGPHMPPFPLIQNEENIQTLAELGIIFLMFSLGLEFNLRKLKQVGAAALIAALLEIVLMVWVGYEIGLLFGWGSMDSLFLGAILSISSTTIIIKALSELGKTKEKFAQLVFGILIIEDILAIVMIALLSSIAMTGSLNIGEVATTVGKLSIFLTASLVVGLIAVPRLIAFVAGFKNNEVLLITVLGLCFGFSLLAVKLGYSVALGAFVIGAIIAEARHIGKIELLMEPIRDLFSAIFFVAIGLLIDPKILADNAWPVAVITVAVVMGKVLTCTFGTFVAGNDTRTSLRVGMSLAQIGEFSFIIATLGLTLKVTSAFLYPIAVAVSAITTLLTPYLIRSSDQLVARFDRAASSSVLEAMGLYTQWIGHLGQRHRSLSGRLIRKWILQMAINTTLMAGIFVAAAFIGRRPPQWLPKLPVGEAGLKGLLWLAAVVCSLPLFIATFRKLQALGMLISETRGGSHGSRGRLVVSHGITITGTAILGLLTMVLSSALLPPWEVLIVLLGVALLVSVLLRRFFIRIYSKAQIALKQTLDESPPSPTDEALKSALVSSILHQSDLETVLVASDAVPAGKMIREMQLRSVSGASIVAIQRGKVSILNPGPDEEMLAHDQLLLLGTRPQLDRAKELLTRKAA